MNEEDREDLESLGEIVDAIGLGEALKDGAYGYSFNSEELTLAFEQAKNATSIIQQEYVRLLDMEN